MNDIQRDIEAIDELVRGGWSFGPEQVSAWQRTRARLTPDRERVARAIAKSVYAINVQPNDGTEAGRFWLAAADAAIAAMGEP